MRPGRIVLLVGSAMVSGAREAVAQCALCGQTAQYAADPETASRTFATAILILLIPTLALLAGAGILLWKFRGSGGNAFRDEADLEQPHPGPASHLRLEPQRRIHRQRGE
jgi:hypothetical protein